MDRFENSDEASESDSAVGSAPTPQGSRPISSVLARQLTEELIDYQVDEPIRKAHNAAAAAATRLTRSNSFGFGAPSEDEEGSQSAPTSPTRLTQRKNRRSSKLGQMLGLSSGDLRREAMKAKKEIATRLLVESESYNDYVDQTVKSKRASMKLALPETLHASSNSMLLTSDDIPLEVILVDPTHRKTLRQYAESLFCDESLLFWERVMEFRRMLLREPATAPALALNIWENFLSPNAEKQLMVRNGVADDIKRSIDANTLDVHTFDAAEREAFSTMQFSLYPQYLNYLNAARIKSNGNSGPTSPHSTPTSPKTADVLLTTERVATNNPKPNRRNSIVAETAAPSLRDCLTKRSEVAKFLRFASTQLCEENVAFWHTVNNFQSLTDELAIVAKANAIWDEFLSPQSVSELNVGSKTRKKIHYELSNKLVSNQTFNDAQREIYKLISLDVYPKYVSLEYEGSYTVSGAAHGVDRKDNVTSEEALAMRLHRADSVYEGLMAGELDNRSASADASRTLRAHSVASDAARVIAERAAAHAAPSAPVAASEQVAVVAKPVAVPAMPVAADASAKCVDDDESTEKISESDHKSVDG